MARNTHLVMKKETTWKAVAKQPEKAPQSWVGNQLAAKAELYDQRNSLYGDNYKRFGPALKALMGDVELKTPDDFNRFGILVQAFAKFSRYAVNFHKGGHDDSLDDLSVYAMMLKELDNDVRQKTAADVGSSSQAGA
jgi:hypothetical protein